MRRPPRWTLAFLRALERCGEVRRAAEDAAVDHTTAYARRKAHPDFAAEWDGALAAYAEKVKLRAEPDLEAGAPAPPPPPAVSTGFAGREERLAVMPRARPALGRWGKWKEEMFLAELVASANVRRAAKAAGVSTQAVYKRRAKDRRLRQAWDMAVETGRARLAAMLVAAANASLDPDDLPDPESSPLPPVSVGEAIAIARLRGPAETAGRGGGAAADDPDDDGDNEWEEARDRIVARLGRIRDQENEKYRSGGWAYDEAHDAWAPPGWGRPEHMAVGTGGPRGSASHHCPHCGGGLSLSATSVEQLTERQA